MGSHLTMSSHLQKDLRQNWQGWFPQEKKSLLCPDSLRYLAQYLKQRWK
jgi:hypothetical protein